MAKLAYSGRWVEKFFSKVTGRPGKGCWLWTGYLKDGYGKASSFSGLAYAYLGEYMAHRISWALHKGPVPKGLQVLHHCDIRNCVNPDHLYLGTNKDNVGDRVSRGRTAHNSGEKHGRHKLTWKQVLEIRKNYIPRKITRESLAARYCVSKSQISAVLSGRSWRSK